MVPSEEGVTVSSAPLSSFQVYFVLMFIFIFLSVSGLCGSSLGFVTLSCKDENVKGKLKDIAGFLIIKDSDQTMFLYGNVKYQPDLLLSQCWK